MKTHVVITKEPLDESGLTKTRQISDGMGAVVLFLGVVRGQEGPQSIQGLEYEAFEAMAHRQFQLIFEEIERRWPIESIRLVHRVGFVATNESSLWVEVIAPHRKEAFDASQYLIDEMKKVVPIWKKVC